jgi:hypothetical protein
MWLHRPMSACSARHLGVRSGPLSNTMTEMVERAHPSPGDPLHESALSSVLVETLQPAHRFRRSAAAGGAAPMVVVTLQRPASAGVAGRLSPVQLPAATMLPMRHVDSTSAHWRFYVQPVVKSALLDCSNEHLLGFTSLTMPFQHRSVPRHPGHHPFEVHAEKSSVGSPVGIVRDEEEGGGWWGGVVSRAS